MTDSSKLDAAASAGFHRASVILAVLMVTGIVAYFVYLLVKRRRGSNRDSMALIDRPGKQKYHQLDLSDPENDYYDDGFEREIRALRSDRDSQCGSDNAFI